MSRGDAATATAAGTAATAAVAVLPTHCNCCICQRSGSTTCDATLSTPEPSILSPVQFASRFFTSQQVGLATGRSTKGMSACAFWPTSWLVLAALLFHSLTVCVHVLAPAIFNFWRTCTHTTTAGARRIEERWEMLKSRNSLSCAVPGFNTKDQMTRTVSYNFGRCCGQGGSDAKMVWFKLRARVSCLSQALF